MLFWILKKIVPFIFIQACLICQGLHAQAILFVHLGPQLPQHFAYSIFQAWLWNPDCPIYLIANQQALQNAPTDLKAECIACETLSCSKWHQKFRETSNLSRADCGGLWFCSTERF